MQTKGDLPCMCSGAKPDKAVAEVICAYETNTVSRKCQGDEANKELDGLDALLTGT